MRDSEIDVQNRAIDVLIRANDPDTIRYLIDVLKDENEFARRAAVEVLNEIGDPKSVKFLLEAIKDDGLVGAQSRGDAWARSADPRSSMRCCCWCAIGTTTSAALQSRS